MAWEKKPSEYPNYDIFSTSLNENYDGQTLGKIDVTVSKVDGDIGSLNFGFKSAEDFSIDKNDIYHFKKGIPIATFLHADGGHMLNGFPEKITPFTKKMKDSFTDLRIKQPALIPRLDDMLKFFSHPEYYAQQRESDSYKRPQRSIYDYKK